ncbi:hypothetical protein A2715_02135 [Candidatus Woesebacteria bacterium RIFCSPHIGHO2_01_FULL_39_32]|uniref:Glutamyl-tRNA amidotransferase n=2 Tax=Candidatus Woeseibacteriota TaxID=1752722 RepID=A0A0G0PSA2_9BACT|nr:MAG: hypothetical protein UT61_C0002G0032 [Candidatus Woesebacteria bacterium GW2011_GWA1_39_8]OGM03457.1 MAG: hypothetical protein A2124_02370 [Candidatus Woesebacteria bacterium GWB1_37_5]OGM23954.1 MAG: hypothetical protein A2715_02135 [Candidatus Woesebacteria bacterium RIFCSPHIGHO2_01_FULL_39_32]OGM37460.1 MAG: hypothetical protein A3F01_03370 [Candidatus Woesebacteria bacterium RIFCSPHIGHO2_12_FULL_38_11]OGM64143.1 MAG: hypothetical protein A2893_03375 [Candidatus Woesebacteria bacteri
MIADNINQKITEALKSRDEIRLSTLRMLSSALNYEKIAKQHDLSKEEELVVVKREAKKRTDAIESLLQARGRLTSSNETRMEDRLEQEEKELEILKKYLPEELSDEELQNFVDEAIKETGANEMKDMGKVIGTVMQKSKGRADGKRVAEKVKEALGTRH